MLEILELLIMALGKQGPGKILVLKKADTKLKVLKLLYRLTYEEKIADQKSYIALAEKTIELGKILGGWLKKAQQRP